MKIGELANFTGCPVETIRFYERSGLIEAPGRSAGNYRVYGASHVERLAFIRHCRLLDMTLSEIGGLLHFRDSPAEACDEVNSLLDRHLDDVRVRIEAMQQLEQQLVALRARCVQPQAAAHCGILRSIGPPEGTLSPNTHALRAKD